MDITFKTDDGIFNYRVCAVIIDRGRLLAMMDERSPYYYLPGGRVQLHETADDALCREVREELGIEAEIVRPLWLNQGFFVEDVSGQKYHELCLYYLVDVSHTDLSEKGDRFTVYEEGRKHTFRWLSFDEMESAYLYPKFIKRKIRELPEVLTLQAEFE